MWFCTFPPSWTLSQRLKPAISSICFKWEYFRPEGLQQFVKVVHHYLLWGSWRWIMDKNLATNSQIMKMISKRQCNTIFGALFMLHDWVAFLQIGGILLVFNDKNVHSHPPPLQPNTPPQRTQVAPVWWLMPRNRTQLSQDENNQAAWMTNWLQQKYAVDLNYLDLVLIDVLVIGFKLFPGEQ